MPKALRVCVYGIFAAGFIGLFLKPQICAAGVQNALKLCAETLVPSLFPFMILSGFFLRSGLCTLCGAWLSPVTTRLFRLPGESAGVLLLAMVGGFPVGIKMTANLLESRKISQKQAKRMCLFCFNAGPAFVLSAVGAGLYGSTRVGGVLFGALCLSALTVGIVLRFTAPKPAENTKKGESCVLHIRLSAAFTQSVSEGMQVTLQICAWVALFGGISALLKSLPLPEAMHRALLYVTEVSNGVNAAAGHLPLPAVAALLSFGGLAVHCQVLADLTRCGVSYLHFFCARTVGAALSAVYCLLLLYVFPCEVRTFAGTAVQSHAGVSVSVPASAALLLCAVLFLWEVESKQKVCYNTDKAETDGGNRNAKTSQIRNCAEMRILRTRTSLSGRGNGALPLQRRCGKGREMPKI